MHGAGHMDEMHAMGGHMQNMQHSGGAGGPDWVPSIVETDHEQQMMGSDQHGMEGHGNSQAFKFGASQQQDPNAGSVQQQGDFQHFEDPNHPGTYQVESRQKRPFFTIKSATIKSASLMFKFSCSISN